MGMAVIQYQLMLVGQPLQETAVSCAERFPRISPIDKEGKPEG